jgi:two-component system, OmpR family, sensor kinase
MFSSLRNRSRTLRARLVAAMLAVLTVASLTVGVVVIVSLQRALYNQIDAQLNAAAGREQQVPPPGPQQQSPTGCQYPRGPWDFSPGQAIGTLNARICDGEVTSADLLVERGQTEPDLTPYHQIFLNVPVDGPPSSYQLGGLGEYRMVAKRVWGGAILVTGLPLAGTKQTLYVVAGVVVGATVIVLAAAGFAGAVIIRRTLRPLSRIAATATRVSQLRLDRGEVDLSQRVGVADTDPETEVGQVGVALNRMLDHVGNALEARHASETRVRKFVADASHELRTPLSAIRGYAELSRRTGEEVPPEVAHMLGRVESAAARMTTLVDDLLLLARLDSGRPLAHERVDLSRLIVDAVSDAHAAGLGHRWQLEVPEEPVMVSGDPIRLTQVVANLLANARTHTPEGTKVTVGLAVQGNGVLLTVADDGPGIPRELMPHIFERFTRGDGSRSRKESGSGNVASTGLGLAIVQAIVSAHHGSIEVESAPGRTSFMIRLPFGG